MEAGTAGRDGREVGGKAETKWGTDEVAIKEWRTLLQQQLRVVVVYTAAVRAHGAETPTTGCHVEARTVRKTVPANSNPR